MSARIANIGSLNIDLVYRVPHFVQPGETLASLSFQRFAGGKGLNQSVALSKAGASVSHIGCTGSDGEFLVQFLREAGVDCSAIHKVDLPTGHAIIQVNDAGENCIILFGGANETLSDHLIDRSLSQFGSGDIVLLQNETSGVRRGIECGKQRGLQVAFNPAPCTPELANLPLHLLDYLIVNRTEAEMLSGENDPENALKRLRKMAPASTIVLTQGGDGALLADSAGRQLLQTAFKVDAVDTTAAGDTFIGYFLAALTEGETPSKALELASKASAICVTKPGAAPSIPTRDEVIGAAL
ncbi:MAG: ribokinase [Deltaproteobacteria bacterium]|nr:ribokinase [Deltaproteobacteria bacterium]